MFEIIRTFFTKNLRNSAFHNRLVVQNRLPFSNNLIAHSLGPDNLFKLKGKKANSQLLVGKKTYKPLFNLEEHLEVQYKKSAWLKEKEEKTRVLEKLGFKKSNYAHVWLYKWAAQQTIDEFHVNLMPFLCQKAMEFMQNSIHNYTARDLSYKKWISRIYSIDEEVSVLSDCIQKAFTYSLSRQGPSIKSRQTTALEILLQEIAKAPPNTFALLRQKEIYQCVTPYGHCNISLLLKHADLTQLQLSNTVINRLYKRINQELFTEKSVPKGEGPLALLPLSLRRITHIYTKYAYLGINKVLRDEEIDDLQHAMDYFLLGCLFNHTLNQLPILLDNAKVYPQEKAILKKLQQAATHDFKCDSTNRLLFLEEITSQRQYQQTLMQAKDRNIITPFEYRFLKGLFAKLKPLLGGYGVLYRREYLKEQDILHRFHLHRMPLPSITSTSQDKEIFNYNTNSCVFFPSSPRTISLKSLSHFPKEQEITFPAKKQVSYLPVFSKTRCFTALFQSPVNKHDMYWPEHALHHALKHHLNNLYQDCSDTRIIGGDVIHRPNHGLAHTYRMMTYLPVLRIYFALHADDPDFQYFCQEMDYQTLCWLQIAASFSVTGRESEIAFQSNPKRYNQFREASRNHFVNYVIQARPLLDDPKREEQIERFQEIIRYMGNSHYPKNINRHPHAKERTTRNFLHTLFSLAHKLDLPRCYSYSQFKNSLAPYDNLVTRNECQETHWQNILHYVTRLIELQGDHCHFKVSPEGEVIEEGQRDYKNHFGRLSLSLNLLITKSETLAKPTPPVGNPFTYYDNVW